MLPLKLKIPSTSQTSTTTSISHMRQLSRKRRLDIEYEDDEVKLETEQVILGGNSDDDYEPVHPPRSAKRARVEDRRLYDDYDQDVDVKREQEVEVMVQDEQEYIEIDVEEEREQEEEDPQSRYSQDYVPSSHQPRSSSKRKPSLSAADKHPLSPTTSRRSRASKKRTVVYSDEEEDDDDRETGGGYEESNLDLGDDDDFKPDVVVPKRSGSTSKGRGKPARPKFSKKGATEKAVEKEIFVKDERKSIPPAMSRDSSMSQGTKRSRAPRDDDDILNFGPSKADVVEEKVDIVDPEPAPLPPPPKKKKLPPIKKNKSINSAGPSTLVTRPPLRSGTGTVDKDGLPTTTPLTRKPAGALGATDFDLRDASVYAQLFTKPGGSTPNSGLNRREKEEERRRELNRMREEARAKRAEEARQSFNLQAAHDKIARFEQKLHHHKALALYPNILGAAFKEAHERARRHSQPAWNEGR